MEKVKQYTEIKELTPAIVDEFIDYIMVSQKQVIDGKTVYPIDIYYNGVGIITAPSAEEYEEMFQERLKQKRALFFSSNLHKKTIKHWINYNLVRLA